MQAICSPKCLQIIPSRYSRSMCGWQNFLRTASFWNKILIGYFLNTERLHSWIQVPVVVYLPYQDNMHFPPVPLLFISYTFNHNHSNSNSLPWMTLESVLGELYYEEINLEHKILISLFKIKMFFTSSFVSSLIYQNIL